MMDASVTEVIPADLEISADVGDDDKFMDLAFFSKPH